MPGRPLRLATAGEAKPRNVEGKKRTKKKKKKEEEEKERRRKRTGSSLANQVRFTPLIDLASDIATNPSPSRRKLIPRNFSHNRRRYSRDTILKYFFLVSRIASRKFDDESRRVKLKSLPAESELFSKRQTFDTSPHRLWRDHRCPSVSPAGRISIVRRRSLLINYLR